MGEIADYSDSKSSSETVGERGTMIKVEPLELNLPTENMCARHIGHNGASSSGSKLRSSFIGMGFLPSLVDKVIEEKGEDDVDLLLETLCANAALQKSISESSDSLDSFLNDEDTNNPPKFSAGFHPKEEPDVSSGVNDDKRATLVMMKFSVDEVEFAMDKLGEGAPVNELVDFIIAAQIAGSSKMDADDPTYGNEERKEDCNNEALFGTMDKTLRLLEMGFSENEISSAIEKFGSEVPISELADSIFAGQIAEKDKHSSATFRLNHSHTGNDYRSFGKGMEDGLKRRSSGTFMVKTEEYSPEAVSQLRAVDIGDDHKGKRPKQESLDDSSAYIGPTWIEGRKGDHKFSSCRMPLPRRDLNQVAGQLNKFGMSSISKPMPCKSLDQLVAKPPYFFYGNVTNVSHDSWNKISQFLYALEPEFVNTQFFSALNRKEGYIHNLPSENRFHILPKPPMTIEEVIPYTKKWWPSWDTRKQLSCISSETSGISQLCDRLGKILVDSRGLLSFEQQRDILHHCRTLNLVWVGQCKLSPIEPEHLERILGYPLNHTRVPEYSLIERLQSLRHCFQIDTLGYHLSVLKSMFPKGLTMLSLFSGIGGAELTLHQLGIHLKGVVSVEISETKRNILKKWWHNTGQTGELVQIDDIQKLASSKLESLIEKFGGFDFVICQNPCTYSSRNSKMVADGDSLTGFDFSLFCEFVRVLHRVRSTMERRR